MSFRPIVWLALALAFMTACASESEAPAPAASEEDIKTPQVYCVDAQTPCVLPNDLSNSAKKFLRDNPRLYEYRGGHHDFSTCTGYGEHKYEGDFVVSAQKLVQSIATSQPKALWSGTSQYELTYDRNTKKLYTKSDPHPPIAKGMVFILTLKIAPLVYIPVAFEIVESPAPAPA